MPLGPRISSFHYSVYGDHRRLPATTSGRTVSPPPSTDFRRRAAPRSRRCGTNVNRKIVDITDRTSNTLLVTEQAGRPDYYILGVKQATNSGRSQANAWGPWASYQVFQFNVFGADGRTKGDSGGPCTINCNNSMGVYAFHSSGANAVFADGSVRFLKQSMHPDTLAGIVTCNGGEILADF